MSLNQNAFNEGLNIIASKYRIPVTDLVKLASFTNPFTYGGEFSAGTIKGLLGGLGVDPSQVGPGALAAGVGIPAAAALWYKMHSQPKTPEAPPDHEKKAFSPMNTALGAGAVGIPMLAALGAWNYLNYRKGQQDTGGEDVDSILNINPEGQHQVTHEPKSATRPMKV